jgi:magnesium-transporting ATPase (P-type)
VLEPQLEEDYVSPDEESDFVGQAEPSEFESEPEILTPHKAFDPSALKWRSFWWIPMWIGVGITTVSALIMYGAWNSSGFGFWFACAWFPFAFGVLVMTLAWTSRTARWLHVRVHQKAGQKPERIAISLPIPLRLTAWFLRVFGKKIPSMGETSLDEVIMALDATSPDAPFYVEVNEGDNGERVEVYIG